MKSEEYLKQPYTRILVRNGGDGYSAEVLEFPGCFAQGETADEAMNNLEESAKAWIQACEKQGMEIPEPFMNQGFGGKIALRLPRSLHRQIARMAERDNVSINQFLVSAIAAKVGADDFYQKVVRQVQARMETSVQVFMSHHAMTVNTVHVRLGSTASVQGVARGSAGTTGASGRSIINLTSNMAVVNG